MIAATVIGKVWVSTKLKELPSGALVTVAPDSNKNEHIVALDPLGCGEGERVLLVTGSTASNYFSTPNKIIDALVVASIDHS
ncbi:EutN/CcmL family microcompartment protein [Vibrio tapetis]|uniref:Ethanolamine utilization protein EutN/carboxysome structural protein Ccml n=1 Tax=Vibrio tapetis subsp. tapetis TaxID=1671868 RepID=A0A2N8ZCT4_9VIBR|nr:EutN/CcmL family microcompartment protein [Vibrio tapetis]SON49693.1 Ethanolamine utilization protein EutN/carboxysome structural protein Ccml [Vibrio tapetis subsp. tapetis]